MILYDCYCIIIGSFFFFFAHESLSLKLKIMGRKSKVNSVYICFFNFKFVVKNCRDGLILRLFKNFETIKAKRAV